MRLPYSLDGYGRSALHLAALQSDLEAVRALVEGGIDVNRDRTYKVSAARPTR
jgi:ankyrin repeat protein